MQTKIEINKKYLESESQRMFCDEGSLKNWIIKYCKRNGIGLSIGERDFSGWGKEVEKYLVLDFKSDNQANCFVRKGNAIFPYFEFL